MASQEACRWRVGRYHILKGLVEMEDNRRECSGAVFLLKRTG